MPLFLFRTRYFFFGLTIFFHDVMGGAPPPKLACKTTPHFPLQNHQKCNSFSTSKRPLKRLLWHNANLQAFLQAKSMKSLREETYMMIPNLPKLLYFTVVLNNCQCA